MPTIQRPTFFDNQILAPDDLTAAVDYSRNQLARHARQQHTWGIVEGLALSVKDNLLVIAPGVAIDGRGREIVVPESHELTHLDLDLLAIAKEDKDTYAIVLMPDESPASPNRIFATCAGSSQASRHNESFIIQAEGTGDIANLDEQRPPTLPDQSPEAVVDGSSWKILLGFVEFDKAQNKFFSAKSAHENHRRKMAGVRADSVESRDGSLTLRASAPDTTEIPTLVFDQAEPDKNILQFGLAPPTGELTTKLAWIDKSGNLNVKGGINAGGAINSPIQAGKILAFSGEIDPGLRVDLPDNITEEMLGDTIDFHLMLSPVMPFVRPTIANPASLPLLLDCSADSQRTVTCNVAWLTPGSSTALIKPHRTRYLMILSAKEAQP